MRYQVGDAVSYQDKDGSTRPAWISGLNADVPVGELPDLTVQFPDGSERLNVSTRLTPTPVESERSRDRKQHKKGKKKGSRKDSKRRSERRHLDDHGGGYEAYADDDASYPDPVAEPREAASPTAVEAPPRRQQLTSAEDAGAGDSAELAHSDNAYAHPFTRAPEPQSLSAALQQPVAPVADFTPDQEPVPEPAPTPRPRDDAAATLRPQASLAPQEVRITCKAWKEYNKDRKDHHVRYAIEVQRGGEMYTIDRRWSACADLADGCSRLGRRVQPAYVLRFKNKSTKTFDPARLDSRKDEVNAFFGKFAEWLNNVLRKDNKLDLLAGHKKKDPKQVISDFFRHDDDGGGEHASNLLATVYSAGVPVVAAAAVVSEPGATELSVEVRGRDGKLGLQFGKDDASFPALTGISAGSILAQHCPEVKATMALVSFTTSGGRYEVSGMLPTEVKRHLGPEAERPLTLSFGNTA